jgi:hypothetical protein
MERKRDGGEDVGVGRAKVVSEHGVRQRQEVRVLLHEGDGDELVRRRERRVEMDRTSATAVLSGFEMSSLIRPGSL